MENIGIGLLIGALILTILIVYIATATKIEQIIDKLIKTAKSKLSAPYIIFYTDTQCNADEYSYATVFALTRNEAYKIFRQRKSSRYKLIQIKRG